MKVNRKIWKRALAVSVLAALIALLGVIPTLGAVPCADCSADSTSSVSAGTPLQAIGPMIWTDPSTGIQVIKEEKSLYSVPKLDRSVSYPGELNYIKWMRYAVNGTPDDASQADAVIICLSGLTAGNGSFDHFGKQLVSKGKRYKNMNIEVWAVDRRVNNLEDLTGLNKAEELGRQGRNDEAAEVLEQYYAGELEIGGNRFGGFLENETAPYLSEFGLRVHMEDLYTLVTTKFPNQNDRKKKVFVAGDSLGGVITADFACWDFDGNPNTTADAGYNNLAGVMALDCLMTPNAASINVDVFEQLSRYLPGFINNLLNQTSVATYLSTLEMIRSGLIGVLLPIDAIGYTAPTYLGFEITAMLADGQPDEECTLYHDAETDPQTDMMLRIAMSRNIWEFLSGTIVQKRIRITNEAMLGVALDNNFDPLTMLQCAMGFLTGGPIAEKTFPFVGDMDRYIHGTSWDLISGYMPYDKMYIPSASEPRRVPFTGPLYRWLNYDEIAGSDATRYTTPADEVSDIHDVAKAIYEGPSNTPEWYYTTRFFVDLEIVQAEGISEHGIYMMHADKLEDVPTFIRLCDEGTHIGMARINGMDTSPELNQFHHLDVLMADMDEGTQAYNKILMPLCDFMASISPPTPPQQQYTITASAGSGGTISPSGQVSVDAGSSQSFSISANSGYHVQDVRVDGSSVGAVTQYTFSNVQANHTIEASFAADSSNGYIITATAGPGGSISPSGSVQVNRWSSQSFTITPNSGYHVQDVRVDGSSVGAVTQYTFRWVRANHTIEASFAQEPEPSTLTVTGINPSSASRYQWWGVNAEVAGTGFESGATVKLVRGSATINASNVAVKSSNRITCGFRFWFNPRGTYDVVVTNPDGQEATLAGGFTVR